MTEDDGETNGIFYLTVCLSGHGSEASEPGRSVVGIDDGHEGH